MYNLIFAGNVDVTEVILITFTLFFVGLILYLRREDRREGYPLEDDVTGRLEPRAGLFFAAQPKSFILGHGAGVVMAPREGREPHELTATRTSRAPGSPLTPMGDPMLSGVGPGAFAQRARKPDVMHHGQTKIAPLRATPGFSLDPKDPDPRGMTVVGADGVAAGIVSDAWIDRSEYLIRYLEVELTAAAGLAAKRVLVPMPMAVVSRRRRQVTVDAVLGSQFAQAPALENPDQITFYEEDRVSAYFGGGYLYATPSRLEPML